MFSWGGGGYAPLGHPKPKLPDDDDEMEEYLAQLRDAHAEVDPHLQPKSIQRLRGEGIVEVSAGYGHVAAISDAGDLWIWGTGLQGQLGLGTMENQPEPQLVSTLQEKVVIAVSVGHSHSICISDEDLPYAWGSLQGYAQCWRCFWRYGCTLWLCNTLSRVCTLCVQGEAGAGRL